ncbi:phosphoglycerate kinase [Patescibacteria group bacterium]|nr:MAG: phosphoglycerate kinase [Patescibacteria group bacterium]
MKLKTVKDWPAERLRGKRVLVRADFNVPMNKGKVGEDWRIKAALPTIRHLSAAGAKIILASHLGRPSGRRSPALSLRPVARHLQQLLGKPTRFVAAASGSKVVRAVRSLRSGDILLLENLRFEAGEGKNSPRFARALADLADFYVNDAFAASHRSAASIVGVQKYLPSAAGLLLAEEIQVLSRLLSNPKKPFLVLIGGVKIETKIGVISALARRATRLAIGGALAVPFLKAKGFSVGASPLKKSDVSLARRILRSRKSIMLPTDVVVAASPKSKAFVRRVDEVGPKEIIYDIGPQTIRAFAAEVKKAETIVWNGPLGLYEERRFSHGTRALALVFGARAQGRAYGVVGGGETIDALALAGVLGYIDWVSTGGGAMLEFLEGKQLPGIEALLTRQLAIH